MPYSDPLISPEGFEGFLIDAESSPINEAVAFEGFAISTESDLVPKFPLGFEALFITYLDAERFIKITDFRGRPLAGVTVTAQNVGGAVSDITGENGIAALEIDAAGTTNIVVSKNKAFRNYSYVYASEASIINLVIQPRLLE
jgi:hypothetical protein